MHLKMLSARVAAILSGGRWVNWEIIIIQPTSFMIQSARTHLFSENTSMESGSHIQRNITFLNLKFKILLRWWESSLWPVPPDTWIAISWGSDHRWPWSAFQSHRDWRRRSWQHRCAGSGSHIHRSDGPKGIHACLQHHCKQNNNQNKMYRYISISMAERIEAWQNGCRFTLCNRDCKCGWPFRTASEIGRSPHLVAVTWKYKKLI